MRACVRACVCVRASSCTNTETSMARLLADVLEAVFDQPFDIQCPVLLLWLLALHARVHVSTCVRIYPHPLRMLRANHSPSTHARTHARAHPHMHMHTHTPSQKGPFRPCATYCAVPELPAYSAPTPPRPHWPRSSQPPRSPALGRCPLSKILKSQGPGL